MNRRSFFRCLPVLPASVVSSAKVDETQKPIIEPIPMYSTNWGYLLNENMAKLERAIRELKGKV